jgi:Fe-S oxidoreductase
LARSEFLEKIYGTEINEAFRVLKMAADPENLLNPGKIVSSPPMDDNLRYGADYVAKPFTLNSLLDFSAEGSLVNAIENCNGAGVCRGFDGMMCPSFQATREESHTTRGRANMLRAFISGKKLPNGERGARREKETIGEAVNSLVSSMEDDVANSLDLCLACKGCKSECPSGVDMAKLKYEFFNHYYKSHSREWRDYLFGYFGTFAQFGAPFGKLANWGLGNQVIVDWAKRMMGIALDRQMPKFGKVAHPSLVANHASLPTVLYLPDAFTRYFEPEIEAAAMQVLHAAGMRVIALRVLGAGRTLISKSFLDAAKRHAQKVRDEIAKVDPDGKYPVVGAEPSEIYTLKDEFLDLFPHDEFVQALVKRTWLIDEFLLRKDVQDKGFALRVASIISGENMKSVINEKLSPLAKKVSLHGHCYQKARPPADDGLPVGQQATAELLRAVGYEVDIIPSGCCGMAGSFGYETEHYDLSMAVGELVLFPEIRKKQALNGTVSVAAPGTSCREQIADGTGVAAQHPMVLIANLLPQS